jgi:hypothetical protein
MRSLPQPPDDAGSFFQLCISRIKDRDLKRRLSAVQPVVAAAATEFTARARATELHQLRPHIGTGLDVTTAEMVAVYTSRMAKTGQPGRALYDQLKLAPPDGICPLCGHRPVDSLDHHLPKARYPTLAVVPHNLVPACFACNKRKETHVPASGAAETLHPYFDSVASEVWLVATVIAVRPAAVVFTAQAPATWPPLLRTRVGHHLSHFELGPLYAAQAAVELTNIRFSLGELYVGGGAAAVQQHLDREARSRRHHCLNSWQSALYTALAASSWYCDAGFYS